MAMPEPVNVVIQRIGMGKYQWKLFGLCGLGWLADNMVLQALAVVLPEVQKEFKVSDKFAGMGTSAAFAGMILGATFWGIISDIIGRKYAFNFTLLITAVFVTIAVFAPNFYIFCFLMIFMGIGIGGNLPIDGAIFLEFLPRENQNLLTLLSLFWPLGQLIASVLGWILIPSAAVCDPFLSNSTILVERRNIPRNQTINVPTRIYRTMKFSDECTNPLFAGWRKVLLGLGILTFGMVFLRVALFRILESPKYLLLKGRSEAVAKVLNNLAIINGKHSIHVSEIDFPVFNQQGTGVTRLDGYSAIRTDDRIDVDNQNDDNSNIDDEKIDFNYQNQFAGALSLLIDRVKPLFALEYRKTTILIWSIWALVALGYTMFNSFLPKYFGTGDISLDELYSKYLLVSLAGVPGSIFGAMFVDSILGRRGTMALATLGTAFSLFLVTKSNQLVSSCVAAFLQNIMYGVIYSYTPEVFDSKVRGTATGVASALGRIVGTFAPIFAGFLFSLNNSFPLYFSAFILLVAGIFMLLLPIETRGRETK